MLGANQSAHSLLECKCCLRNLVIDKWTPTHFFYVVDTSRDMGEVLIDYLNQRSRLNRGR